MKMQKIKIKKQIKNILIFIRFGDITPYTDLEKLIAIFTMFISCAIYAYSFNEIGMIFNEI